MSSTIRRKFEQARDRAAALAAQAERSDAEDIELADQLDRAEEYKTELDAVDERNARIAALAPVSLALAIPGTLDRSVALEAPEMSAGEYLAEYFKAYHPNGGSTPTEFIDRAARYIDRAQQATGDTGGIIPVPIMGQVIKLSDSARPVFNSLASRGMPAKGKTFQRPRITQRVSMGTQTEGQALATQKMTVTSDTVTKATQGGYLDITQQDIDWTEPEALQILVQDFVDMYAEWTEGLACDFVEGLIVIGDTAVNGSTYSAWTTTDVGTIVKSYVDAFIKVYGKAKRFPDTVYLDLASWGVLASTVTANKDVTALDMLRRTLSDLGVGPVRWIVGPQFAADTRIIACSSLLEAYEQQKGLLRGDTPSTLVVQLAYAGYTAFYGRHEAVVQLGTDPSA